MFLVWGRPWLPEGSSSLGDSGPMYIQGKTPAQASSVLFEGPELGMLEGSPFVEVILHLWASSETTLCPLVCRSSEEGR